MIDSNRCKNCNKTLIPDEKAIYMKMISRTAEEFLCINCLADKLSCCRSDIENRIRYYRESGNCTLFR